MGGDTWLNSHTPTQPDKNPFYNREVETNLSNPGGV